MIRSNVRTIDQLGRVILPLEFRRRLGLEHEDEIVLYLNESDGTVDVKLVKKAVKSES